MKDHVAIIICGGCGADTRVVLGIESVILCPKCKAEIVLGAIEDEIEIRVRGGITQAQAHFWCEMAAQFPEVEGGDIAPEQQQRFDEVTESVAREWLLLNDFSRKSW